MLVSGEWETWGLSGTWNLRLSELETGPEPALEVLVGVGPVRPPGVVVVAPVSLRSNVHVEFPSVFVKR